MNGVIRPGCNQIVEDQIRSPKAIPGVLIGVGAMKQIENRIPHSLAFVVAGRCIHREAPHAVERLRLIPMSANLTMRHRLSVVEGRRRMPYFQHARDGARRRAGLQLWIGRVDGPDTVDCEVVVIYLRGNRADGQAPHPIGIFCEAPGALEKLAGELHLLRFRRVQAERHTAVRQHLGRDDAGRLLRERMRGRQYGEKNGKPDSLHSCGHYHLSPSRSTAMCRHFPWLKRRTLRTQRVAWPMSIAIQISIGSSVAIC